MNLNNKQNDGTTSRWNFLSLFGAKTKSHSTTAAPGVGDAPEPVLPPDAPKILVVDDDAVILKSTAMKLKASGFAVTTASDGSSAMQAARNERPDLILLDLEFPPDVSITWDGFGILNWLRRLDVTKDIPVIIITSHRENDLAKRVNAAGADGLFQKPVDFGPVISLIKSRLNRHSPATPTPANGLN